MFPRAALIILISLLTGIASVVIYAAFVMESHKGCVHFGAGVTEPYKRLLTHMRQLAEVGDLEQLRKVIVEADKGSSAIENFCGGNEDAYRAQVEQLTK